MSEVTELRAEVNRLVREGIAKGGGGSDNGGMEHRVTALETRLDTILPTLATKADIADVRSDISRWTLTTTLTIIATTLAALVGIYQISKSAPTPPPSQPIIINVPALAPVPSQAPAPARK